KRRDSQAALEWRASEKVLARASEGELLRVAPAGGELTLGPGEAGLLADFETARRIARQRFLDADAGKDGSLDAKEARQSTYPALRTLFAQADRAGDGRLSREEWDGWLEVEGRLLAGAAVLAVVDQGRGLFEFLDADRDGRLSLRELRSAWARLEAA